MPDWEHLQRLLTQAWGAYQRASRAAEDDERALWLIDLRDACARIEREAERALADLEHARVP